MSKLPDEVRAFLAEAGRKGGSSGTGDAKRRPVRSREYYQEVAATRWKRERARGRAYQELLTVAREVGAFLDTVKFSKKGHEALRQELANRLYAAVRRSKAEP